MPTAPPPTPPPALELWVPPPVLSLVDAAPGSPALRGLIRSELSIIVPLTVLATPDTATLRQHLLDNFETFRSSPRGVEWIGRGGAGTAPPPAATQARPITDVGPAPTVTRNTNGTVRVTGIRLSGTEAGTARYQSRVEYRGDLDIPADLLQGDPAALNAWLSNQRQTLRETNHQFDYTNHELAPDQPVITAFVIPGIEGIREQLRNPAPAEQETTPTRRRA